MNTRTVVLLVLLSVLGLSYVWFVLWPEDGNMRVVIVQQPEQPPRFAFSREMVFEEVKMITREPVSQDDPDGESYERTIWHLVPKADEEGERDDPRPRKVITYGRRVRGLEPAEGFKVRGEPLRAGHTYRFIAQTSEGLAQAEFTAR